MNREAHRLLAGAFAVAVFAACDAPAPPGDLIFVDGRAVAPADDSLFAVTRPGSEGFVVLDRRSRNADTLGRNQLFSPFHIQELGGRWYVSDARDGEASIAIFSSTGNLATRIIVDTLVSAPHQFAILPDGRIVLEALDDRLVTLPSDGPASTFTITEQAERPGLLVAAAGGVLHALPGKSLTLYNANGNLRWRLPWPWHERAFVADLAVDAQGRYHVLAGEENRNTFVVFSLSPTTGEVLRWSIPGPYATFAVDRMGGIRPDTTRWRNGE